MEKAASNNLAALCKIKQRFKDYPIPPWEEVNIGDPDTMSL